VVGIGGGRRRWRHIDWEIVKDIGLAWLTTMPAAALIGALFVPIWRLFS
jgi:phosphate/sulfate permease